MNNDTNERFGGRRYGMRRRYVEIYGACVVQKSHSTEVQETNVVLCAIIQ